MDQRAAEEALKGFFELFPEIFQGFNELYFNNLTVETAFLLRVFCQYATARKMDLNEFLPNASFFAKHLEKQINLAYKKSEATKNNREFIICELLQTAKFLDFVDELGRKSLINCIGDYLINENLNGKLLEHSTILLRKAAQNYDDFLR